MVAGGRRRSQRPLDNRLHGFLVNVFISFILFAFLENGIFSASAAVGENKENNTDSDATEQGACLKFLAIGDWGTQEVAATAKSMQKYVKQQDELQCPGSISSLLLVGDNFYEKGITSTTDPLVMSIYYRNFGGPDYANVTFSVIAGNHDHRGSIRAQVDLTDADETHRWYLPRPFYSRTFEQGNLRVLLVFIDTWDLVGGEAEVNGKDQRIVDAQQLRWIKDVLRTEDVDYKIVVGHYPIRSARKETPGLVTDLLPLLIENNVDAYVFGHDHIAQYIQRDGMHYFGSGLGGRVYSGPLEAAVGLEYSLKASLGFISFAFSETGITFRIHKVTDQDGGDEVTYATTIVGKKKLAEQTETAKVNLAMKIRSSLLGQ